MSDTYRTMTCGDLGREGIHLPPPSQRNQECEANGHHFKHWQWPVPYAGGYFWRMRECQNCQACEHERFTP